MESSLGGLNLRRADWFYSPIQSILIDDISSLFLFATPTIHSRVLRGPRFFWKKIRDKPFFSYQKRFVSAPDEAKPIASSFSCVHILRNFESD